MRPLCTFCCGRSHHTLTEDLLWQRLESAHPPQTPDTDPEPSVGAHLPSWVWLSSPVWRPVPPSSPAMVKHCPLHSTPRPHLPSYLRLTSTANSHSQFAFTSNATSPPHPGVTSTSTQTPAHLPHPPHPALTSHNHRTLDRGPQALPSRLSHRLPSQHPTLKGCTLIHLPASLLSCSLKKTAILCFSYVAACLLFLRRDPLQTVRTLFSAYYLRWASEKGGRLWRLLLCRSAGDVQRHERLQTDRVELEDTLKPADTKPLLHRLHVVFTPDGERG